jgi:hypothetical protein
MEECEHLIKLLKNSLDAANKEDVVRLKELSNQTIHSAAVYNDKDNVLVAVLIYSLSKIVEKGKKYYKENYERYLNFYLQAIEKIIKSIELGDEKKFKKEIQNLTDTKELKKELAIHLNTVFTKAKINKASRVYEHGLSLEKTANLLGISKWELMEYIGETSDVPNESKTKRVSDRIKDAEEIFNE